MKIITFLLFSFCLVLSAHGYDVTFTDASGLKYGYTSGNDTLTLLSGNGSGITGDLVIPSHLSYNSKPYVVGAIDDRDAIDRRVGPRGPLARRHHKINRVRRVRLPLRLARIAL